MTTNDTTTTTTASTTDDASSEPATPSGSDKTGSNTNVSRADRSTSDDQLILETTPTLRPTLLLIGITLLAGTVAVGYLIANPETIAGDPTLTEVVWNIIGVLVVLVVARLVLRLWILQRTTYQIRSYTLRRKFSLLYRHHEREVPLRQLRGHEYQQSRIQTLLGYGTIRLLTGGTNQSLGFIEFEDVPNPDEIRAHVTELAATRD
jgi:uncharacterized membrane protein YdbT with pleckstrin-like domain